MAPLSDRPTHLLMRDMLFEALRVKDERLNALAVEICGRCGADVDGERPDRASTRGGHRRPTIGCPGCGVRNRP